MICGNHELGFDGDVDVRWKEKRRCASQVGVTLMLENTRRTEEITQKALHIFGTRDGRN